MRAVSVALGLALTSAADAQSVGEGGGERASEFGNGSTPGWDVRIPARIEIALGQSGTLPITLALDRGLAVSKDGPLMIDLDVPPRIVVKKRRLGRADAVDPEADTPRFAIPVKVEALGDHTVRIHLRCWICGTRTCRPLDVVRQTVIAGT